MFDAERRTGLDAAAPAHRCADRFSEHDRVAGMGIHCGILFRWVPAWLEGRRRIRPGDAGRCGRRQTAEPPRDGGRAGEFRYSRSCSDPGFAGYGGDLQDVGGGDRCKTSMVVGVFQAAAAGSMVTTPSPRRRRGRATALRWGRFRLSALRRSPFPHHVHARPARSCRCSPADGAVMSSSVTSRSLTRGWWCPCVTPVHRRAVAPMQGYRGRPWTR